MVSVRAGNDAYATKLCFDSPTSSSTSCGTAAPTNTGPEADSADTVTGAFTRLRTFGPRTSGAFERGVEGRGALRAQDEGEPGAEHRQGEAEEGRDGDRETACEHHG